MVNLNSIKTVFVDFDDTLCVHLRSNTEELKHEDWIRDMVRGNKDWYLDSARHVDVPAMRDYLKLCNSANIPVICVSWSTTSLAYNAKIKFLDKKYPGLVERFVLVGSREAKLQLLDNWCKSMGFAKSEILLIDDHPDTQYEVRAAGYNSCSPMTIVSLLSR